MAKTKDCIECRSRFNTWNAFNQVPRKSRRSRALGKRMLKEVKRAHGIYEFHLYAFDFERALFVRGVGNRQLLNKGGKP